MSSLPKLTVVSLVVIAIGALQFAVPALTHKATTMAISDVQALPLEQTNSTSINQHYQHA